MSNEVSSKKLGELAARVLNDKNASADAKALAGSVLTQRPNHKDIASAVRESADVGELPPGTVLPDATDTGPRFVIAVDASGAQMRAEMGQPEDLLPGMLMREDAERLYRFWKDRDDGQASTARIQAWLQLLLGDGSYAG